MLLEQVGELGVLARLRIGVDQWVGDPAKRGEAFRRLMGFFEEWDRLLEPAGILVVDPEVGHRHLRIRVLAAELGLLPLEHVLEQRHGFVELLCPPVRRGEVIERGQGVGVVGAELGDLGVADALEQGDRLGELAGGLVRHGEVVERGQGVGVVGAELGDLGVADALEQGDRLGELAGGLVRRRRGC